MRPAITSNRWPRPLKTILALATMMIAANPRAFAQTSTAPAPMPSPGQPGWIQVSGRDCFVWNASPIVGETVTWSGDCKYRLATGQGDEEWFDQIGAKLGWVTGKMKDGKLNGLATATSPTGGKYVGEFKDGKRNGRGIVTGPTGAQYVGEFKNDKPNGGGTVTLPTGEKYVGGFKDDKFNGQGTMTRPTGEKYVGEFKDNKFNGQGTMTWPSGEKYVGEFKDGNKYGQGIVYAPDGTITSQGISPDGKLKQKSASFSHTIQMVREGGVYVVPILFNNTITLDGIIDSGAADVSIPADLLLTLTRAKTLSNDDFIGNSTYVLADGSRLNARRFIIHSLKVGDVTINNVVAHVSDVRGDILLGQSFLEKFDSWQVDNKNHALLLK